MAEGFFTDAAKKFCIDVTAMGAFSHSVMSSIDWTTVDAFTLLADTEHAPTCNRS
jgi:hypothetical protein